MKAEGFLKGHPVSLCVLDYGLFRVHEPGRTIGISGFLVETSLGEQVLIDTGFPAKYAGNARAAARADGLDKFGEVLRCTQANLPGAQLAMAGTRLNRIDLMIQTHTHIDHIGGLHDCPQAPILMAGAERKLRRPLYWGPTRPMNWPDRSYLLITRDTDIGPGFRLLFTPGHTPGQLALLLKLPRTGTVLLTSDAVSRPTEPQEGFEGAWDADLAQRHASRLMELASEKQARVIFGHCPDQWNTLKKAPDRYL